MTQLKETIDRIMSNLDTKEWIKCPLCGEDWNKLRPCAYMQNGKMIGTYVCVTCAESTQSIKKVMDILGIEAYIHDFELRSPYNKLSRSWGDYWNNAKAFKCKVENGRPCVMVEIETDDMRMRLTDLKSKATTHFDNIFQCMSYFKHLIEEENRPKDPKRTWGNGDEE